MHPANVDQVPSTSAAHQKPTITVCTENVPLASASLLISGTLIKTARLASEYHESLEETNNLASALQNLRIKADLFTFVEKLTELRPSANYYTEWDSIAALPITSYETWWK